MKTCKHCGKDKDHIEFFRQVGGDGLQTVCKKCKAIYQQQRRLKPQCDPEIARLLHGWGRPLQDSEALASEADKGDCENCFPDRQDTLSGVWYCNGCGKPTYEPLASEADKGDE